MSRVKGKDTSVEKIIRSELHKKGFRFKKHVAGLPGRPDVVFMKKKVAVFIDGDFWHGYRFPIWKHKMSRFWIDKIESNRKRDKLNIRRLRRNGWIVIRIWQHQIEKDFNSCIDKVTSALEIPYKQ